MTSTAPAKSQPLHNFSLPQWKWPKNQASNPQRGRKLAGSVQQQRSPPSDSAVQQSPPVESPPSDSAPRESPVRLSAPPPASPMPDCASGSESGYVSSVKSGLVYEKRKNSAPQSAKLAIPSPSSDHKGENSEKRMGVSDSDVSGVKEGRSKILIRLRPPNIKSDEVQDEGKPDTEVEGKNGTTDVGEAEELVAKTWNLRPRKPINKQPNANGSTSKVGGSSSQDNRARLQLVTSNHSGPDSNIADKKAKKQKFSISLLREEIEEDIFALTGSKPARRPKKRAKTVQKQLDNLFPGMWLSSVTPDAYKVSEAHLKG